MIKLPNLIIQKIVLYTKEPKIVRLFFTLKDYRLYVNSSNNGFDELYYQFGTKNWKNIKNIKCIESFFRLQLPLFFPHSKILLPNYDVMLFHFAEMGNLEIIKWITENLLEKYELRNDLYPMDFAARNGHLDLVKWFNNRDTKSNLHLCSSYGIRWAAINNQLDTLKWLYANKKDQFIKINLDANMFELIRLGHFEIVQFLYQNFYQNGSNQFMTRIILQEWIDFAILQEQFEITKFLYTNKNYSIVLTNHSLNLATQNKNTKITQWLLRLFVQNLFVTSILLFLTILFYDFIISYL